MRVGQLLSLPLVVRLLRLLERLLQGDEFLLEPLRPVRGFPLAALALFPRRRAYGSAAGDFMVPTASALFTAASSDELRAAGMRLGNEDAPDDGAAYLIRELDGVDAQLPPAEAELAKALDSVGFERVMIEFESPGPLGTPFAHNKLVALERRPGPTASLIKYLELTADGRPVMDGLARYILGELAAF